MVLCEISVSLLHMCDFGNFTGLVASKAGNMGEKSKSTTMVKFNAHSALCKCPCQAQFSLANRRDRLTMIVVNFTHCFLEPEITPN